MISIAQSSQPQLESYSDDIDERMHSNDAKRLSQLMRQVSYHFHDRVTGQGGESSAAVEDDYYLPPPQKRFVAKGVLRSPKKEASPDAMRFPDDD